MAEVGRTYRAFRPPEGRKTLWRAGALAGRKLEAPPDAEHEPREGETVRGRALTIIGTRWFDLWVSARRFSIRRKAFSGFRPSCLYGQDDAKSFGSKVNLSGRLISRKRMACLRKADRSAQRLVGRALE